MKRMSIFKNIHNKENYRLNFFINIFTIIILMWNYHSHDDIFTYGRTIENKNKRESSLNICFKRYLAEYEGETENAKTGLYKNSPYYLENKGTSNYDDNVSIYGNIKNRDSKALKLYKTGYKHRYSKKKGLSKLDCYYENKIFKKIDYINEIRKRMQNDKKSLKKMIIREHSILIFYTILPLLGLTFPVLFGQIFGYNSLLGLCDKTTGHSQQCNKSHMTQTEYDSAFFTNTVISLSIIIITICVIIYIFIKFIKYEKLKAGKGKMNFKEYCRFCKGFFYNKKN